MQHYVVATRNKQVNVIINQETDTQEVVVVWCSGTFCALSLSSSSLSLNPDCFLTEKFGKRGEISHTGHTGHTGRVATYRKIGKSPFPLNVKLILLLRQL